jgi:hypothetical protein
MAGDLVHRARRRKTAAQHGGKAEEPRLAARLFPLSVQQRQVFAAGVIATRQKILPRQRSRLRQTLSAVCDNETRDHLLS